MPEQMVSKPALLDSNSMLFKCLMMALEGIPYSKSRDVDPSLCLVVKIRQDDYEQCLSLGSFP